jgi:hypothetical protein
MLLVLLWVALAICFVVVLFGRRAALIVLAVIVGGCVTWYASLLFFALRFPGMGGMYLMVVYAPLIALLGAAATGYVAFRLTKERKRPPTA